MRPVLKTLRSDFHLKVSKPVTASATASRHDC